MDPRPSAPEGLSRSRGQATGRHGQIFFRARVPLKGGESMKVRTSIKAGHPPQPC
jgi:hypothetical protein